MRAPFGFGDLRFRHVFAEVITQLLNRTAIFGLRVRQGNLVPHIGLNGVFWYALPEVVEDREAGFGVGVALIRRRAIPSLGLGQILGQTNAARLVILSQFELRLRVAFQRAFEQSFTQWPLGWSLRCGGKADDYKRKSNEPRHRGTRSNASMSVMKRAVALLLALAPAPALACKCLSSYPVCREVAASDVVFIGTVESVEPGFLDPWHWRDASSTIPVAEIDHLRSDESPAAATRLKAIYLRMLGDMPEGVKHELEVAVTTKQVEAAFSSIAAQGRRARFRVQKSLRVSDDDDKKDEGKNGRKDDDGDEGQELTIWNGGGDCGIDFQVGETYLVYASDDEETGRLQTSICYRTRRLTDAGGDLAYLYFFENGEKNSSRLEGFITTERKQDRPTSTDSVEAPATGLVVAIAWEGKTRYARSAGDGRFIFDGLAAGRYQVRVYDSSFPQTGTMLAGPDQIDVPEKGCASAFLVVPPRK